MTEEETTDFRYALLGMGIGLVLAVCVLLIKLCTMGECKCPCTGVKLHAFHHNSSAKGQALRGGDQRRPEETRGERRRQKKWSEEEPGVAELSFPHPATPPPRPNTSSSGAYLTGVFMEAPAVENEDLLHLCHAINVTVTPAPFTVAQEGENVTLSCVVSQRRRNTAMPVVKWTFLSATAERAEDEVLIARVNMRKARFYGNYTKSFQWPKLKLTVVKQGKIFDLLVLNVSEGDRGLYMCRVQEFRKHQERWKAFSNCTAATELRDVYLCAVLICSVGLLCMCMFTVTVTCQYIHRKHRLKDNYLLVKSPQNSSGETVTSVVSGSPALPKKQRSTDQRQGAETQTSKAATEETGSGTVYAQILFQERRL
ncbi:hypothetical protein CRUP_028249 [Coryphaenoides rupestris]|nr:hypothetical protein CRUP_028249 [Coryphaenoides rupestris]